MAAAGRARLARPPRTGDAPGRVAATRGRAPSSRLEEAVGSLARSYALIATTQAEGQRATEWRRVLVASDPRRGCLHRGGRAGCLLKG